MSMSGPSLPPGNRIGDRYEVLRYVGNGRAGEVYQVFDHNFSKQMALKLLRPQAGQPATWDEAQVLKRLESDYLLPVYNADVAFPSDLRYITMPFMSGGDLETATKPKGVELALAVRWGAQIASAVDRVHDEGLLHRDIKPGNVFLDSGDDSLLGDLGLAVRIRPDGTAPPAGTLVTAAPEVLGQGGYCSKRSDVYSLAATVFYLICGRYPVNRRGSELDVYNRVISGDRRRLRDLAPHVSQALGNVIERSLAMDPRDRAASALAFANQLGYARRYARSWRLISDHDDHPICLKGSQKRLAKGLTMCSVPAGPARWNIEIRKDGGQRMRRYEVPSLTYDQVLVEFRRLAAKL